MGKIKIVEWVFFEEKDEKEKLKKLALTLSKGEFIVHCKQEYNLTMVDATTVANIFYK